MWSFQWFPNFHKFLAETSNTSSRTPKETIEPQRNPLLLHNGCQFRQLEYVKSHLIGQVRDLVFPLLLGSRTVSLLVAGSVGLLLGQLFGEPLAAVRHDGVSADVN